jgi:hypothetical protein
MRSVPNLHGPWAQSRGARRRLIAIDVESACSAIVRSQDARELPKQPIWGRPKYWYPYYAPAVGHSVGRARCIRPGATRHNRASASPSRLLAAGRVTPNSPPASPILDVPARANRSRQRGIRFVAQQGEPSMVGTVRTGSGRARSRFSRSCFSSQSLFAPIAVAVADPSDPADQGAAQGAARQTRPRPSDPAPARRLVACPFGRASPSTPRPVSVRVGLACSVGSPAPSDSPAPSGSPAPSDSAIAVAFCQPYPEPLVLADSVSSPVVLSTTCDLRGRRLGSPAVDHPRRLPRPRRTNAIPQLRMHAIGAPNGSRIISDPSGDAGRAPCRL